MTTLILDTPNHALSLEGGLLHISHPEQSARLLPLAELERLIIGKGISITSDLQIKLSELGKELILLGQKSCASIFNASSAPNSLRLLQYHVVSQVNTRRKLAFDIIEARRKGQNKILNRLGLPCLSAPESVPDNLMLYEAELSRHYWQQWRTYFAGDGFHGRERQPPKDPINALLSLTSTLEDSALAAPLLAEGFDLTLGIHHATGYRRASLVLDIKELTRSELELWIINQWHNQVFTAADFQYNKQACLLTKAGQKVFYSSWFHWQKSRKEKLRELARRCHQKFIEVCDEQ
ncbi:CRISPR-associated endonuclease Cas1 [Pseudoalteromonas sp. SS15]|uniref:CRISPR-associated endonuclease Cas1 n=1 Tax=Pseudoalteromonas sp. SS15 TaxID=3139393 RepID=UPI003BA90296